jgi:hypothetical protein
MTETDQLDSDSTPQRKRIAVAVRFNLRTYRRFPFSFRLAPLLGTFFLGLSLANWLTEIHHLLLSADAAASARFDAAATPAKDSHVQTARTREWSSVSSSGYVCVSLIFPLIG